MYNTAQLYELSFVSPSRRPRTKPRIVFTIKAEHLEEIIRRLRILGEQRHEYALKYCPRYPTFGYPMVNLFGRKEFGYGRCGLVNEVDEDVRFEIELAGGDQLSCCTLTLKVLTMALAVPIANWSSNQLQQVDLETRCDSADIYGYNHAVGGYISSRLMSWLREQGRGSVKNRHVPVPEEVTRAMRHAWSAVCSKSRLRWTRECSGYIAPDGMFTLGCFGNACDLAIYPDCGRMTDSYIQLSCHNLDSADQQITLIAGLAKLCELARRNE